MSLPLTIALIAFSVAALAVWAALRRAPADPAPFDVLRRHAEELASRNRGEALQALTAQIQPVMSDLSQLRIAQAEKLGEGFRLLTTAVQEALRTSRAEQTAQLGLVQQQVQQRLDAIQASNEAKLEQIRLTVDEKLHDALERRLGESFNLVAQRLEQVQKGLGEMQSLAQDVGGLKRALTNVKIRGVLGEAQLGALLEQFLSAGQYASNVKVKPRSAEVVEFAVKLPGPEEGGTVWLPIDAKFPLEDYQRLMEAYEAGDVAAVDAAGKALENRLLSQARDIRDKYLAPPYTTDFALLFLPFEGLYAEALRRPGLFGRIQRECKVTFVGPTTLTAFLNSLQVGFKTLAISRQSSEVWKVLGHVKAEFGRFGTALSAVQDRLDDASKRLGEVSKRKDLMEKRLAGVEVEPESLPELPSEEPPGLPMLRDGE